MGTQASASQHQGEQSEVQRAGVIARRLGEIVHPQRVVQNPLGRKVLVSQVRLQSRPEIGTEENLLHGAAERGVHADGMGEVN